MRVRFTATAFAELKDIHDYIARDNPRPQEPLPSALSR